MCPKSRYLEIIGQDRHRTVCHKKPFQNMMGKKWLKLKKGEFHTC